MRSLVVLTIAILLAPSAAWTDCECIWFSYQTRNNACSGGAATAVIDMGPIVVADAAACAANCGCKPNATSGRSWNYNCSCSPLPR